MPDELLSRNQRIHFAFEAVINKIRNLYKDKELIIFIDEIDRLPIKKGIGDLIKSNNVRFAMIGVADDINEIIVDHASVERKIRSSKVKIEGLTEEEVKLIFSRSESVCSGLLLFKEKFRDLVIKYCDGFPYLIHVVCYEALRSKLKSMPNSEVIKIDEMDFHKTFKKIASPHGDHSRYTKIVSSIRKSPKNREAILFALVESEEKWVETDRLLRLMNNRYHRHFDANIIALINFEILKRNNRDELRFIDPVIRAMIKYSKDIGDPLLPQLN